MGLFGQMVIGPAGSGKSTFCHAIGEYCKAAKRTLYIVNLDPAAEHFAYDVAFDIRDLISVDDVTEELKLGPNGALIFCMQYLSEHLEWLKDKIDEFARDDVYFIFDCPGQIELYTHLQVMPRIASSLQSWGFRVGCVCLVDSTFISEVSKYISGALVALSAMVHLELPHINVLSKADLVTRPSDDETGEIAALAAFESPCMSELAHRLTEETGPKFRRLNQAMATILDEFGLVGFVPMSIKDEDSVRLVMHHLDNSVQYGDDVEPSNPKDMNSTNDD